jgi:hypothetical protein
VRASFDNRHSTERHHTSVAEANVLDCSDCETGHAQTPAIVRDPTVASAVDPSAARALSLAIRPAQLKHFSAATTLRACILTGPRLGRNSTSASAEAQAECSLLRHASDGSRGIVRLLQAMRACSHFHPQHKMYLLQLGSKACVARARSETSDGKAITCMGRPAPFQLPVLNRRHNLASHARRGSGRAHKSESIAQCQVNCCELLSCDVYEMTLTVMAHTMNMLFHTPDGWSPLSCNAFIVAMFLFYTILFHVLSYCRLFQPAGLSAAQRTEWHSCVVSNVSAAVLLCGVMAASCTLLVRSYLFSCVSMGRSRACAVSYIGWEGPQQFTSGTLDDARPQ